MMNTETYLAELKAEGHGDACKLHECCEWDGLPICTHSLEFQYCNCFDEGGEAVVRVHKSNYSSLTWCNSSFSMGELITIQCSYFWKYVTCKKCLKMRKK